LDKQVAFGSHLFRFNFLGGYWLRSGLFYLLWAAHCEANDN